MLDNAKVTDEELRLAVRWLGRVARSQNPRHPQGDYALTLCRYLLQTWNAQAKLLEDFERIRAETHEAVTEAKKGPTENGAMPLSRFGWLRWRPR